MVQLLEGPITMGDLEGQISVEEFETARENGKRLRGGEQTGIQPPRWYFDHTRQGACLIALEEIKAKFIKTCYKNGLIGADPYYFELLEQIRTCATASFPVLIMGETGTGKEIVAKCIHEAGPSPKIGPFKAINCAGIPTDLLESELFGHTKGAFTGASKAKKGLFEEVGVGTLFLDEIGDMPPAIQAKVLRVLNDGTFRPVGSTEDKKTNARIISATNKNLAQAIEKEDFRRDLSYRLNGMQLHLWPLHVR